ncbi:MAG: 50S ribosomal protein L32 [Candidatus Omnitrophica bacterium]|nr:50S ribosomal protein L32 [Candidatus Omnitrophota bacterium]MCM8777278.1 50S ribosomal protein L32 [Candidatus Omnitrophota bacterium]
MPNPKRRHSNSRTGKRRGGHKKVKISSLSVCSNCGSLKTPHTVCDVCGYYKGVPVLQIKEKSKKE